MKGVRQTLLDSNPLLLWLIDETSGTLFRDQTRFGDHAAMSGSPILGVNGPGLGALGAVRLNGSSQSVNRDAGTGAIIAALPTGSAARSLEIWARPTAGGGYAGLCYGNSSSTNEHVIFGIGGTGAGSAFTDGVNGGNNKNWVTAATVNSWGHFVMTYAGGAGGAAVFYRNGLADVTSTLTLGTDATLGKLRAGLRSDDGRATQYFTGDLAVASIYNYALTQAQVQEHYQAMQGAKPNLPTRRMR